MKFASSILLAWMLLIISCVYPNRKSEVSDYGRSLDSVAKNQVQQYYKTEILPIYNYLGLTHFLKPIDSFSVVVVYPKSKHQDLVFLDLGAEKVEVIHFIVKYSIDKKGLFQYDKKQSNKVTIGNIHKIRELVRDIDSITRMGFAPINANGTEMCSVFIDFTIESDHYYFGFADFKNSKHSLYNDKVIEFLSLLGKELKINPISLCN